MLIRPALALCWLLALLLAPAAPAQANSVVVTDCTETGLMNALAGSGPLVITFNCGGTHAPATILVSNQSSITVDTTLDGLNGGNRVTVDGQGGTRLFSVLTGANATFKNIILAHGASGDGGCLYANGVLVLNSVELAHCQAGASSRGGALFVDSGGSATLVSANVHDNQADVSGGGVYSIAPLTVTNSYLAHNLAVTADGGGLWSSGSARIDGSTFFSNTAPAGWGGGIYNQGTLSVTYTQLNDNHAQIGGGGIQTYQGTTELRTVALSGNNAGDFGGGLYNGQGILNLAQVTLSSNHSANGSGGGLYNDGQTTLSDSSLADNTAFAGGGIYNTGVVSLTRASLSYNYSHSAGGGLLNYASGQALLIAVTLDNNQALPPPVGQAPAQAPQIASTFAVAGGGIDNLGRASLLNLTLSHNDSQSGGGIANSGSLTITNGTLADNSALTGGGLYQNSSQFANRIRLFNTVVATSQLGTDCFVENTSVGHIVSYGYNLADDSSCSTYLTGTGDLFSPNVHLGPLANNGGPTLTHLPEPPSAAINAIPLAANGCGTLIASDQRGAPRPIHTQCDIGAVEAGWVHPALWLALVRR